MCNENKIYRDNSVSKGLGHLKRLDQLPNKQVLDVAITSRDWKEIGLMVVVSKMTSLIHEFSVEN